LSLQYYNCFTALWILSWTTRVSQYQKKHSLTYPDRQWSFICFLHLLYSMASSLFNLHAWQCFWHILCPSLVCLLVWYLPLHTPYVVFFSQHMPIPLQPVEFTVALCHVHFQNAYWFADSSISYTYKVVKCFNSVPSVLVRDMAKHELWWAQENTYNMFLS